MNENIKYKNIISLGYFCSVALELERIGLRSFSSPFDWVISEFQGLLKCIENNFEGFLDYDNLAQNQKNRFVYKDLLYNIEFYHDFNCYMRLDEQLEKVKTKYKKRINRFYANITQPTLFLRYIANEEEAQFIEQNHDYIIKLLRNFNLENDIIFITNNMFDLNIDVFYVQKDKKDNVARKFLNKNKELKEFLTSLKISEKQSNLKFRIEKIKNKYKINNFIKRRLENLYVCYIHMCKLEYNHSLIY